MPELFTEQYKSLYLIDVWSEGYFDISPDGEVICTPNPNRAQHNVGLQTLVNSAQQAGASLPMVIRFPGILKNQVEKLDNAFTQACLRYDYSGGYQCVFPVKVNHQHTVVQSIVDSKPGRVGLETGTKPELMLVLQAFTGQHSVIVCNGYKDAQYIELALWAQKLGHQVHIMLEKKTELFTVLEVAKKLNVIPHIGLRVRLDSSNVGLFHKAGGEESKFGLPMMDVFEVCEILKERKCEHYLTSLHFHLGTQISQLLHVQQSAVECCHLLTEISKLGFAITTIDVGGGIAIDYEGSHSSHQHSRDYDIQQYADAIVSQLTATCRAHGLPQPQILTESGRYLASHHAVFIADIIHAERPSDESITQLKVSYSVASTEMWRIFMNAENVTRAETFNQATMALHKTKEYFRRGKINLVERVGVEKVYLKICHYLEKEIGGTAFINEIGKELKTKCYVNFSLFQMLMDHWGIKQIFPILPLTHLTEPIGDRIGIYDITCDSDGVIGSFCHADSFEGSLPVPFYNASAPYLLGFFLMGAYQETLAGLHNLLAKPDVVDVDMDNDGQYFISSVTKGVTVSEVLGVMHFNGGEAGVRPMADDAEEHLNHDEFLRVQHLLQSMMNGGTYFDRM